MHDDSNQISADTFDNILNHETIPQIILDPENQDSPTNLSNIHMNIMDQQQIPEFNQDVYNENLDVLSPNDQDNRNKTDSIRVCSKDQEDKNSLSISKSQLNNIHNNNNNLYNNISNNNQSNDYLSVPKIEEEVILDGVQSPSQNHNKSNLNLSQLSNKEYIMSRIYNLRIGRFKKKKHYVFYTNEPKKMKQKFPSNIIRTTKYRWYSFIFMNLLEQYREYSNIYFLFIMILSLLPGLSPVAPITAVFPVVFILGANMLREGIQDLLRWREDRRSNYQKCCVLKNGVWTKIPKKSLHVGDIVKICREEDVPADIIVLSSSDSQGLCFIETSNLDGETTMKIKMSKTETSHLNNEELLSNVKIKVACEPPHKHFDFNGVISFEGKRDQSLTYDHFIPRSSTLLNTDYIYGTVVYTGRNTKMFLNLKKTKSKFSIMQNTLNRIFFGILILNQIFAFSIVTGSLIFQAYTTRNSWYLHDSNGPSFEMGFSNYLTALILLNLMIPMSLYVSLEFVKMIQARFMTWDKKMYHNGSPLQVYSNNLNSDLAKIEIIFSDKTGTLTENKMMFKYATVGSSLFDESKDPGCMKKFIQNENSIAKIDSKTLLLCLSVCHTIVPHQITLESAEVAESLGLRTSQELENPNETVQSNEVELQVVTDSQLETEFEIPINSETLENLPSVNRPKPVISIRYDGESPDEVALIEFARSNGYILQNKSQEKVTVEINGEIKEFPILALLPFTSHRKRMSVIIKASINEGDEESIIIFTKGADSEILNSLELTEENNYHKEIATKYLTEFSKEGLRTLVLSYKVLSQSEFDPWYEEWIQAENSIRDRVTKMDAIALKLESSGYTLIGTTAIEDCLQEGVPETLKFFREAGVQIWMLTGDKMETAINIGRSSEMISPEAEEFLLDVPLPRNFDENEVCSKVEAILDQVIQFKKPYFLSLQGKLLDVCLLKKSHIKKKFVESLKRAETVICCRSTPDQKARLVKLGKRKLKKLGLAIGDGANDVSMIQQARVGVGIRGREGSQASRASDFSIARFFLLRRLLAVHGHWSYYRSAKFVQYSFYKNMLVTFYQALYTIFNGFTMQTISDSWVITLYNTIFTVLIPFVFGIFEKDIPDEILENDPRIYKATLKEPIFSSTSSFAWIFRAFVHASIIFFVSLFFTKNTGLDDLWTQAAILSLTSNFVVVLKGMIEMKYHTPIHFISIWLSLALLPAFYIIYSAFKIFPSTDGIGYFVSFYLLSNISFYLITILIICICLIPEISWKLVMSMLFPKRRSKLKVEHHKMMKKQKRNLKNNFRQSQNALDQDNELSTAREEQVERNTSNNEFSELSSVNVSELSTIKAKSLIEPDSFIKENEYNNINSHKDTNYLQDKMEVIDISFDILNSGSFINNSNNNQENIKISSPKKTYSSIHEKYQLISSEPIMKSDSIDNTSENISEIKLIKNEDNIENNSVEIPNDFILSQIEVMQNDFVSNSQLQNDELTI